MASFGVRDHPGGITRAGRLIHALTDRDAYEDESDRVRILLVGGLSGNPADAEIAIDSMRWFAGGTARARVAVSAVPCANPGGLATGTGPANGAGGRVDLGYPPVDGFFGHPESPEARYLWRWACYLAPDVVIEIRAGPESAWEANEAAGQLRQELAAGPVRPRDSLTAALERADPGALPGVRLTVDVDSLERELGRFVNLVSGAPPGPSGARRALTSRSDRDPIETGRDLAVTNGRTLDPFNYTQGVALSGRLRFALLNAARSGTLDEIASLVEPVLADPESAFGPEPTAPALATVVWAEEMSALTGDKRYDDFLTVAMRRFRVRGRGGPPSPLDTNFIAEDHFFAAAVIGRGAQVESGTDAADYVNSLTEFILEAGIQESGGLFRHSRRGPVHWGRGNGFAALGLAEYLTYIRPDWRRDGGEIESKFRRHMTALRPLQHPSGMYLQVLDCPGSYQELTATCMIGYAMARGIRLGILDEGFRQPVDRAWRAATQRIDASGNVIDGCASTGVMDGLRSYLDRRANSGYDDRTGAMALWFAAEMARLLSEG